MVPMLVDIWKNIWMNCDVWVSERCTFATDGSFIKPCFFKHESLAVGAALYFVDKFIEEI